VSIKLRKFHIVLSVILVNTEISYYESIMAMLYNVRELRLWCLDINQLLVIHSYNKLKFKINTHISILNLVALNYSIEIFVEIWPIDIPNLNNLHPLI
jgi:collagenase-like PrtC family protease